MVVKDGVPSHTLSIPQEQDFGANLDEEDPSPAWFGMENKGQGQGFSCCPPHESWWLCE